MCQEILPFALGGMSLAEASCVRQLFLQQREEHGVLPLAALQVRAPLHALADIAAALGMRERALVEAVDLQLDAMEAEIDEQMPLEEPRRVDADATSAKARVDREAAGLDDSVALVDAVECDAAGGLSVDLDHEPAERVGLALGALDLGDDVLARLARASTEKRPRLLVGDEVEQEVGVAGTRAAQLDAHVSEASRRRRSRAGVSTPVPSATPPRISARPPNAVAPKRSPRKIAPYASAIGGIRYVTSDA